MPVYEYLCKTCDDKFEVRQSATQMVQVMDCPEGHPGARKVLSVFATISTVPSAETFNAASCSMDGACGEGACCMDEA